MIYQVCTINIMSVSTVIRFVPYTVYLPGFYHNIVYHLYFLYIHSLITKFVPYTFFTYQVLIIILFTNQVCTKEEQEVLARGSRKSEQLRQRLMKDRGQDDYEKAVQHKNKLLEFDKTRSDCVVFVMLENLQKY